MVLRIMTELHLKRLIVGGMERVTNRTYLRNESMDAIQPLSSSIEVYQAYADYDVRRCHQHFASG